MKSSLGVRKWLLLLPPPTPKVFGNKFTALLSQISLLLPLSLMVSLVLITFLSCFPPSLKVSRILSHPLGVIHFTSLFYPLFLLTTSKLFLSRKSALLTPFPILNVASLTVLHSCLTTLSMLNQPSAHH